MCVCVCGIARLVFIIKAGIDLGTQNDMRLINSEIMCKSVHTQLPGIDGESPSTPVGMRKWWGAAGRRHA